MKHIKNSLLCVAGLALLITACKPAPSQQATAVSKQAAADSYRVIRSKPGRFDDVKEFLVLALQDRGLKVNNLSHISDMLQRTGKDIGRTTPIYEKAEAIEFCSAVVSRDMMEADPDNIVFCPYIIFVYVKASEPGKVYVSYRKPEYTGNAATDPTLKAVEDLVKGIIADAMG